MTGPQSTISNSNSISGCSANAESANLSSILEEYHEFADVFSKSEASTLPLHCPYDLKIDLDEGAEPHSGALTVLGQKPQ